MLSEYLVIQARMFSVRDVDRSRRERKCVCAGAARAGVSGNSVKCSRRCLRSSSRLRPPRQQPSLTTKELVQNCFGFDDDDEEEETVVSDLAT